MELLIVLVIGLGAIVYGLTGARNEEESRAFLLGGVLVTVVALLAAVY